MTWRRIKKISWWFLGIFFGLITVSSALLIIYKDNIKDYAITELNQYLNKKIQVGYIDISFWKTFPNVSLDFDNILIYSKFGEVETPDTALFAEKIRLRFDAMDIINGTYTLEQVDVYSGIFNMVTKADGSINYDFIKSQEKEGADTSDFSISLEKIKFKNTTFQYLHQLSGQHYQTHIKQMDVTGSFSASQFTLSASSDIFVKKIQNKTLTILSNKQTNLDIAIYIDTEKDVFEIVQADLKINQLPFSLSGSVIGNRVKFDIASTNLKLEDFVRNFSIQELDVIKSINGKGDVTINLAINGDLNANQGLSLVSDFSIANGSLSDKDLFVEQIELKGHYDNGVNSSREILEIHSLKFKSTGSQFNSNLTLVDFDQPRVKGKAKGQIDLAAFQRLFGIKELRKLEGIVNLNSSFDFRMNQPKYDLKNIFIYTFTSNLQLENIAIQTKEHPTTIYIPDGKIVIQNQRAVAHGLSIKYLNSDLKIDGTFDQIVDYFAGEAPLIVEAMIESQKLDLDAFGQNAEATKKTKQWLFPNDIKGAINVKLNEVAYSNHLYHSIKGSLSYDKRTFNFQQLYGENAGAWITGSLTVQEIKPMELKVSTLLNSKNIPIKQLFKEWNNFEQDVIGYQHIDGKATVSLQFTGNFDLYNEILDKNSVIADASIHLENGSLVNVPTFKEITGSLNDIGATRLLISKSKLVAFEKELSHLKISTLSNTLSIRNGVMILPKMEIKTNALDLNISGTHSFDNEIKYSLDFRFREVKGKNISTEFGDIIDDETGFRVYLKMTGTIDDPIYAWDKESKKEDRKLQQEAAKEEFKSVLKSGFGINKKDESVQPIHEDIIPKEKIEIQFKDIEKDKQRLEDDREKKKGKLQLKIDQWKLENEKNNESFEIID